MDHSTIPLTHLSSVYYLKYESTDCPDFGAVSQVFQGPLYVMVKVRLH